MPTADQRLIEDYIPIEAISAEARREKSIRKGHISTLHLWWARRPLVAARAAVYGVLAPAPKDKPGARDAEKFVTDLCKYPGSPSVIAEARRRLLEAHAARLTAERVGAGLAPAQATITADDIEAGRAPRPRVLDMFAGGGAIPLEALRLGCEAYALDLNPVAHLIQLCTLVYPQQYGAADPAARGCAKDGTWAGLAAEVEHWGKWVLQQVKAEIGDLYPLIPDPAAAPAGEGAGQLGMDWAAPTDSHGSAPRMLTPVAYLWTRTVRCKNPACGGTVPLERQTWLAKKEDRCVALQMDAETNRTKPAGEKTVRFRVVEATTEDGLGFDPAAGSRGGNVACPFCGTVADSTYIKVEGMAARIGAQPMAVACTRIDQSGKAYISAENAPSYCWPDEKAVQARIKALEKETLTDPIGPLTVPSELIISDSKGSAWVIQYGFVSFGDLFTPRQALAMLTTAKHVRATFAAMLSENYSAEHASTVTTLLGLTVSRLANFNSSLCTWFYDGGRGVKHVFARQALPMVWDFAESNPLNRVAASWMSCLAEVASVTKKLADIKTSAGSVFRGSARSLPFGVVPQFP